jgi:HSP20 family protein
MLTTYWTPILPPSLNGARRELQTALDQIYQRQQSDIRRLPLTISEDEQQFYLQVDLPGFPRESIDVRLQDGQLHITGDRPVPPAEAAYVHNERMFGVFSRTVSLPEMIDPSAITAHMQDGVLSITIRKKPEAQPVKIEVKPGDSKANRIAE